jgi:cobalamin biosynthesis protein CobT
MLMAKRILNRKEMRADYDAAERRKTDDDETPEEEAEGDEEEEEEAGDAEAEGEEDEEAGEAEVDEDEEGIPVPKKKKKVAKVAKPKAKPKSRSRAAKVVRMRLVWGVFNNSHQCVATYEFPKRKDADAHAAKLTADKKNTHFVQPVKEPIEEKKEKEKA